jgi:dTDP-4-dehydrorhamnose reductase
VPGELAVMCAKHNMKFVHISTDAVFDGQKGNYLEDDLPNPINAYARANWKGSASAEANPEALIAR